MDPNGHRQHLRERFRRAGMDAFAPHEVLELLLTYAIPRRDTKAIAYALLARFGSFHGVLQASVEELALVKGVGESAAVLIAMMAPLLKTFRRSMEEEQPLLDNHLQAVRYCESLFEGDRYERFYVIGLDTQMRRLNTALISTGDVAEVRVYARHIVSALTQCNALGAVIAHNHPSGDAMPSSEDVLLTGSLEQLLQGIGITLYDHLIVSPTETFSFRRGGLLGSRSSVPAAAARHAAHSFPTVNEDEYRRGRTLRGEMSICEEEEKECL